LASPDVPAEPGDRDLLIKAKRILTMASPPLVEGGAVLIRRGRVVEVGQDVNSSARAVTVVDLGDATLLPGLIDCHTHLSGLRRLALDSAGEDRRIASEALDVAAGLPALLHGGLTTLRDCGYPDHAVFAVRDAARAGVIEAPRMCLSGRAICATGGHGASLSVEVSGADEVRRAVRNESKAGAHWIKLMVTGGTATPGESVSDVQLTFEEVAAAVEEAHRRRRKVSAHCSNLEGARLAVEAGVDSIEHGIALDEELTNVMAAKGVWLSPTLRCTQVEGTAGEDSGIPDFVRAKAAGIYQEQMDSFQRAVAAGVRVAAATDAAQPYLDLGVGTLVEELELYVDLGMTPQAALGAATRDAALMLGADSDVGTIEPGKLADLIAVEGDPTKWLSALRDVRMVVFDGRVVRHDC
jgi:imidazolonepropionase-like amidohydrolase